MVDFDSLVDDSQAATAVAPQPALKPAAQPAIATPSAPPSFDELQDDSEKYAGGAHATKAFLSGVGKGLIGPVETAAEKYIFGRKPEDMRGEEEAHPIASGLGQATGLGVGMLTGTGEAAIMSKAGEAAAGLTKAGAAANAAKEAALSAGLSEAQAAKNVANVLKDQSLLNRVGSETVKQATEMAILQSGDEVAKQIQEDPHASAQSAIANIGLASALGGAGGAFITGAVSPLWKATVGNKLESFVSTMASRMGGREAESEAAALATRAGVELPETVKAQMDGSPWVRSAASKLDQTDTTWAGRTYQAERELAEQNLTKSTVESLGRDVKSVENLPESVDRYSVGRDLGETLHDDLKPQIESVKKELEAVKVPAAFTPGNKAATADAIAKISLDNAWHKAENEASAKLATRVIEKLKNQESAQDIDKFITNLRRDNPFGSDTYHAAKALRGALGDAHERAVTEAILKSGGSAESAQALLNQYKGAKQGYAKLMGKLEDLDEHLHLGKWDGPDTYLQALKEKSVNNAEALLNGLSGKNKASVLSMLGGASPSTLAKVREYHLDNLLTAAGKRKNGINSSSILGKLNDKNLSPQLRELIVGGESNANRLDAIKDIVAKTYDPTHNWSNTARTSEKIGHDAVTPLTALAMFMGHAGSAVMAHIAKLGITEGSDAVKFGLLKFLGSNQPIKSEGLKAAMQFAHNVYRGESLLNKAVSNVFKPGVQVLTDKLMPFKGDREKLDKIVTKLQDEPDLTLRLANGHTGHYMPNHQAALAQTSVQAVQYLQQLKPKPYQPGPLDKPLPPSPEQEARYNRALDIANQPAVVLQHIKDGTIQVSDLQDLKTMYPAMYHKIAQKLSNELINTHHNESAIPYKTRMGLSLFLGQPVDSTMTPGSIQAAQPQAPQMPSVQPLKGKPSKLSPKSTNMYKTPGQAAETDRTTRE